MLLSIKLGTKKFVGANVHLPPLGVEQGGPKIDMVEIL